MISSDWPHSEQVLQVTEYGRQREEIESESAEQRDDSLKELWSVSKFFSYLVFFCIWHALSDELCKMSRLYVVYT